MQGVDGQLRAATHLQTQHRHTSRQAGFDSHAIRLPTCLVQAVGQQPVVVHLWWRPADATTAGIFNGLGPNKLADSDATQALYASQYGPGSNNAAVVVGYDATKGVGAPGSYWKVRHSRGPAGHTYFPMLPDGTAGKCGMYAYPLAPSST